MSHSLSVPIDKASVPKDAPLSPSSSGGSQDDTLFIAGSSPAALDRPANALKPAGQDLAALYGRKWMSIIKYRTEHEAAISGILEDQSRSEAIRCGNDLLYDALSSYEKAEHQTPWLMKAVDDDFAQHGGGDSTELIKFFKADEGRAYAKLRLGNKKGGIVLLKAFLETSRKRTVTERDGYNVVNVPGVPQAEQVRSEETYLEDDITFPSMMDLGLDSPIAPLISRVSGVSQMDSHDPNVELPGANDERTTSQGCVEVVEEQAVDHREVRPISPFRKVAIWMSAVWRRVVEGLWN